MSYLQRYRTLQNDVVRTSIGGVYAALTGVVTTLVGSVASLAGAPDVMMIAGTAASIAFVAAAGMAVRFGHYLQIASGRWGETLMPLSIAALLCHLGVGVWLSPETIDTGSPVLYACGALWLSCVGLALAAYRHERQLPDEKRIWFRKPASPPKQLSA